MSFRPEIEKTTLGHAVQMGLLTPDGVPVRAVDAMQNCWIVWPESVDEPACVYLNEGDALLERDRLSGRGEE